MNQSEKNQQMLTLQKDARVSAIIAGKNPETIFVLNSETCIDFQAVLAVLSYDGPEVVVQSIDAFIFEFLLVLSNSSDNSLNSNVQNNIWLLKRLRDAILYGLSVGIPLGDSDYKHNPFKM